MAANETHGRAILQRHHLFRRSLSQIDITLTAVFRFKQPVTVLLFISLAIQSLDLCYSIESHSPSAEASNHLSRNSASSQQSPFAISETPRSHQDSYDGRHKQRHQSGDAANVTPVSRLVDKREASGEHEFNNRHQPPDESESDTESASTGDSSSNDETGNDYSSSTNSAADDYNATSPSSASMGDETDSIDVDDVATSTRSSNANQEQANAPRRRSEAMLDLARNPKPINVPSTTQSTTTVTGSINNYQAIPNKQRQAPTNLVMQQLAAVSLATPQSQLRRNQPTPVLQGGAGATSSIMSMARSASPQQFSAGAQNPSMTSGSSDLMRNHHYLDHHQIQHETNANQQSTPATTSDRPQPTEPMPVATFNLNMGADRMLIKPHHQLRAETQSPPLSTRSNIMSQQEMATESVNHELLMNQPVPINDRRPPDLLYPASSSMGGKVVMLDQQGTGGVGGDNTVNNIAMRHSVESSFGSREPQMSVAEQDQQEFAAQVSVPSICYTPLALLMVIVVTMLITILVCLCTHILIRHLGRHRFDLIESSRQLNTKYGCGQVQDAAGGRPPMLAPLESSTTPIGGQQRDNGTSKSHSFMLSLFQGDQSLQQQHQHQQNNEPDRDGKNLQRLCDEHGFAFDNPYFRDETGFAGDRRAAYLRHQQQQEQQNQLEQQRQLAQNQQNQQVGLLTTHTDPAREQLHFIEHHISNLHNRQVTSSVKELSILGSPSAAHVVDLTSEEQRAKVIADPKEGDLVSVDITGHDIIGLGFDVYGDQQEGIFIKSVQTRGPARESGCIQPGDRIKCLNISFENMTLQDACDILNCGSPYKMRLLLEKRLAPVNLTKLMDTKTTRSPSAQSQAIMLRQNQPLTMSRKPPAGGYNQRLAERPTIGVSVGNSARLLEATRNCINRLTSLVSGNRSSSKGAIDALDPYRDQFNTGFRAPNDPFEPSQYLGSAAARRQHFALAPNVGQLNAIGDFRAGQNPTVLSGGQQDEAGGQNLANYNNNSQSTGLIIGRSRSASMISNQGDNFSLDNQSASNDLGRDNSLDFNNRNANHRLHGPPLFDDAQRQQVGGRREAMDLHLATNDSANPLIGAKQVGSKGIGARRQSAADVVGQLKDSLRKRPTTLQHLEQTQSQPEIAHNGADSQDDNQPTLTARLGADRNSVDQRSFAKGRPLDLLANKPLINSVSTPTMNLLNCTNKQINSSSNADWQRISSQRNKRDQLLQKQKNENSIREEPASDSSFADSTSKLVEAGKEELSRSAKVTANSTSGLPVIESQFASSTMSSKKSTGTHITCLEPRLNIKKSINELNLKAAAMESNSQAGGVKTIIDRLGYDTKQD